MIDIFKSTLQVRICSSGVDLFAMKSHCVLAGRGRWYGKDHGWVRNPVTLAVVKVIELLSNWKYLCSIKIFNVK